MKNYLKIYYTVYLREHKRLRSVGYVLSEPSTFPEYMDSPIGNRDLIKLIYFYI